jgi:D-alanyl-D-alanine dipeptidase
MEREEFDKLVEETTDLILDKLSEAFYANPGAEQQRRRAVIRSAVTEGFLSLLFAQTQEWGHSKRTKRTAPVPSPDGEPSRPHGIS